MNKLDTPFHPQDQVRNAKFLSVYHWSKWLGMHPRRAYFIAKKKTLSTYPINPSEPLYAHKKPTLSTQVSSLPMEDQWVSGMSATQLVIWYHS